MCQCVNVPMKKYANVLYANEKINELLSENGCELWTVDFLSDLKI